jgi:hypothetical protein
MHLDHFLLFISVALPNVYASHDFHQNHNTNATKAAITPSAIYLLTPRFSFTETPEDGTLLVEEGPLDVELDWKFCVTLGADPEVYPIK